MSSLRILIGAETYRPTVNGAARFAENLAVGMAARGHDVHVVTPSAVGKPVREVHDGVTVHGVKSVRYAFHPDFPVSMPWQALPATARLVDELRPDIVHTQAHMVVGRGVVKAGARAGIPVVATNHFMPENLSGHVPLSRYVLRPASKIAWWDLGRVFGKAAAVTAPTPRAVELLIRDAHLPDAFPVSCGIDAVRYGAPAPAHDVPSVLFVGRMDQEKRVDELIRAFAALPGGLPAHLDIVGDGARRADWTALAASLGIAERVTFHGFVSEEELLAAYARADVFCMPSIAELQSIATLEAMAAGTPVVLADAMALPHLVRQGRNGWLFPPGDVAQLSRRLGTLLADAGLRARMGAVSREIVAEHAIDATLDRFEGLYRQLITGGRTLDRAA